MKHPKNNQTINYSINHRIFFVLGLIVLFFAFIITRMFSLQITNHSTILVQAATQHGELALIPASRGEIYLANSKKNQPVLVATNISKKLVFATTRQMAEDDRILAATKLAPILDIKAPDLLDKMNDG